MMTTYFEVRMVAAEATNQWSKDLFAFAKQIPDPRIRQELMLLTMELSNHVHVYL